MDELCTSEMHAVETPLGRKVDVEQDTRMEALLAAEKQAMALLDAIETAGLIAPGRSERDVERDIYALAEQSFGVKQHWHKRIVRCGINTLCIAAEDPPVREIAADDTVFLDLGPVFGAWEADVGRTYAMGTDPRKQKWRRSSALCRSLPATSWWATAFTASS